MGRPYRIGAHLPEDVQLPFDCTHIDRRPQCPEIVMHADALQHQPLAIEKKAFMGKLRPANAERPGITLHNPVAATYHRDGDIPNRIPGPPEPGIIHGKLLYEQLPVLHAVDDIFSPGNTSPEHAPSAPSANNSVVTIAAGISIPSLRNSMRKLTEARSEVTCGVVTKVPQCAMPTGSDFVSHTLR